MILAEIGEPLILRPTKGECFIISKSETPKGGYIIRTSWTASDDLDGKIIVEPNVDPIVQKAPG